MGRDVRVSPSRAPGGRTGRGRRRRALRGRVAPPRRVRPDRGAGEGGRPRLRAAGRRDHVGRHLHLVVAHPLGPPGAAGRGAGAERRVAAGGRARPRLAGLPRRRERPARGHAQPGHGPGDHRPDRGAPPGELVRRLHRPGRDGGAAARLPLARGRDPDRPHARRAGGDRAAGRRRPRRAADERLAGARLPADRPGAAARRDVPRPARPLPRRGHADRRGPQQARGARARQRPPVRAAGGGQPGAAAQSPAARRAHDPGLDFHVIYEPAGENNEVGGDFYDLFPIADGVWRFAIGDVCGTGPEAAAVTGLARHTLRLLAREGYGVAAVVGRLNQAILEEGSAPAS